MAVIFESDHNWTGNPSPESARFSYTFHPENAFMSFYDYSIDIMSSFELVQKINCFPHVSHILKEPGLVTLLPSDSLDIIVDFHFNETPPEISDPAWIHVEEGVIAFKSGKMHVDGGSVVEVGIILEAGNYAFRVYFAKPVYLAEEDGDEDSQRLAIYFHKTGADETNEVKVLKEGEW